MRHIKTLTVLFCLTISVKITSANSNNLNRLEYLTRRTGPNLRTASDFHDFVDVTKEDSEFAWLKLEETARQYVGKQAKNFKYQIDEIVSHANISDKCQVALLQTVLSYANFDFWAVRMIDSWGKFPPAGLFDGYFSDFGSYKSCVDLNIPKNAPISGTNYCVLAYRPIVKKRPKFHLIIEEIDGQKNKSHSEIANGNNPVEYESPIVWMRRKSQYFHYLYLKTGICLPRECGVVEVQALASLAASKMALGVGPVKCMSRQEQFPEKAQIDIDKFDRQPVFINLNQSMSIQQSIVVCLLASFLGLTLFSSIWHVINNQRCRSQKAIILDVLDEESLQHQRRPNIDTTDNLKELYHGRSNSLSDDSSKEESLTMMTANETISTGTTISSIKNCMINYFSLITNVKTFLTFPRPKHEIGCINGIRSITMLWIVAVHSLQYVDWSSFVRVFENERLLALPLNQPMLNANYVVDNFFLISGLLATHSTCFAKLRSRPTFSPLSYVVSRYLRLTPQILLVSLLYILLPLIGDGPFWYDAAHYSSQNCQQNFWVNLLHIQAFYKSDQMCNLVTWWVSVDMFFHLFALIIIYLIVSESLLSAKLFSLSSVILLTSFAFATHYANNFPPNMFAVMPQVAEMWSDYVVRYFWSPLPHVYPFFVGLWLGHCLANNSFKNNIIVTKYSALSSNVAGITMLLILMAPLAYSSGWLSVTSLPQILSTTYNLASAILWTNCLSILIVTCHNNQHSELNKFLSSRNFSIIAKSSYMIYLSHMLVLTVYSGTRYAPIDLSTLSLGYMLIGNVVTSCILGMLLCIVFESPALRFQRYITSKIRNVN